MLSDWFVVEKIAEDQRYFLHEKSWKLFEKIVTVVHVVAYDYKNHECIKNI